MSEASGGGSRCRGTTFSVALVNRQGEILFLDESETLAEQGAEAVVERIIASIRRLLDKAAVDPAQLGRHRYGYSRAA